MADKILPFEKNPSSASASATSNESGGRLAPLSLKQCELLNLIDKLQVLALEDREAKPLVAALVQQIREDLRRAG